VTIAEWRDELERRNEHFGKPAGYWCYVRPGDYRIGGGTEATLTLPAFWIAKYPVTVQQYRQFIDEDGYTNQDYWTDAGWKWRTGGYNKGQGRHSPYYWPSTRNNDRFNAEYKQPVVSVTWYEAAAFAAWLNQKLSLSPGTIHLPTEAEWEAAAAYDEQMQCRTYPWGKEEPDASRADFGKDWKTGKPAPVGSRPAGAAACGSQDVAGSVWEWCSSAYNGYPQKSVVARDDFTIGDHNVPVRGGAWGDDSSYIRCSSRKHYYSADWFNVGGFRVLLTLHLEH